MIKYSVHVLLPGFETNTYLLYDDVSREAALIDPSAPSEALWMVITTQQLTLKYIFITHGHGDHIGGIDFFKQKSNAELLIHASDAAMLTSSRLNLSMYMEEEFLSPAADRTLKDNDLLPLGNYEIRVIHTPGHTRGGICLYCENLLFSGDTLFLYDIGRTDFPGGDEPLLIKGIREKLFVLPDETVVLPGHGDASTIGAEKAHNPYTKG